MRRRYMLAVVDAVTFLPRVLWSILLGIRDLSHARLVVHIWVAIILTLTVLWGMLLIAPATLAVLAAFVAGYMIMSTRYRHH